MILSSLYWDQNYNFKTFEAFIPHKTAVLLQVLHLFVLGGFCLQNKAAKCCQGIFCK